jgi:hypothetical protein
LFTSGPNPADGNTMWVMNTRSIESVAQTYSAWLNRARRVPDEAFRFAQARFAKDLRAAAQLALSRNPAEALALQAQIISSLAVDYVVESQKIVELIGQLGQDGFREAQQDVPFSATLP